MDQDGQVFFSSLRFGIFLIRSLRAPLYAKEAEHALKGGLENRIEHFLELCKSEVFSKPDSVFSRLFLNAGISQNQLNSMILREGLENTLMELACKGVSLDVDEFKGRKPLIRGALQMVVNASSLDRAGRASVPFLSSGSSGKSMRTPIDMPGIRLLASCIPLVLRHLEAEHLPIVLYYPMPSGSGFMHLITFSMVGRPPLAWFAQWMNTPWWRSLSGAKLAALMAACRLSGITFPTPRLADIKRPKAMVRWLKDHCPDGAVVPSFTGSAIHLIQNAAAEGISLPPLTFLLGGEPLTDRKRRTLEQRGHRVFPWYSSVETGRLAMGCLCPQHPDDMHLLEDRISCIIRPRSFESSGEERPALLFTTIHPDCYKFLLNVETGDEATISTNPCGCPWDDLGFRRRVSCVRSFEKLTLEGTSVVADFLAELVEEAIPACCGGTPADYQFSEEEGEDGITRLLLRVNPAIEMDSAEIRNIVMEHFHEKFQIAGALLLHASSLYIKREIPKLTRSGKMLAVRPALKRESI